MQQSYKYLIKTPMRYETLIFHHINGYITNREIMTTIKSSTGIPEESILSKIYSLRGKRVMLDFDLALLYETENRILKQAVKRNMKRFPEDFMFQLNKDEWQQLITICDKLPKGIKYSPAPPFAFTEQGVTMLASILKSEKAIEVNIQIVRTFVLMRQHAISYKDLADRLNEIEEKFTDISQAINYLINQTYRFS